MCEEFVVPAPMRGVRDAAGAVSFEAWFRMISASCEQALKSVSDILEWRSSGWKLIHISLCAPGVSVENVDSMEIKRAIRFECPDLFITVRSAINISRFGTSHLRLTDQSCQHVMNCYTARLKHESTLL